MNLKKNRTKGKCKGVTVPCKENAFCRLLAYYPEGCCLLNSNQTCMDPREDCSFFSGIPAEHSECVKEESCLKRKDETVPFLEESSSEKEIKKNMTIRDPIITMINDIKVGSPMTIQTPEQITAITGLSFFLVAFVLFFGGSYFLYVL